MQQSRKWYIVYSRPKNEHRVFDLLVKQNIFYYYPRIPEAGTKGFEFRKTVGRPLFAGYIFVELDEFELFRLSKLSVEINLVHWRGQPAVISRAEIEGIKMITLEYENLRLEKIQIGTNTVSAIHRDESLEDIFEAPFEVERQSTAKLILPNLGYVVYGDLKPKQLVSEHKLRSGLRTFTRSTYSNPIKEFYSSYFAK